MAAAAALQEPVAIAGEAGATVEVDRSVLQLLASLIREPLSSVPAEAYGSGMVVTHALGRMRVYLSGRT